MEPQYTKSAQVKVSEALSQFIHNNDFPVDVKDCTGKYIENNAKIIRGKLINISPS